ncbi:hypothetical protein [Paeniglutamicibacter sp. NPDC091659]|uniref:hypothetical protein n=1 Tax=Paeniglutamicibacter sp. NPDC091659 TaxID=3364389 RepID=UPI0037FAA927
MSRRIFAPILALTMSAGLVVAGTMPASAAPVAPVAAVQAVKTAPTKVTINKIKTATVNKKTKTATVKPSVKSSGQAKVSSSKITVKQGKKTVAKNVSSAKLKAGKYTVTTTAKYKTWTNKTTSKTVKTTKLVSDGSKLVNMTCEVVGAEDGDIEVGGSSPIPATALYFECKGAFDGVYETVAYFSDAVVPGWAPSGSSDSVLWLDDVPTAPKVDMAAVNTVKVGVLPFEKLYKTTATVQKTTTKVWSKEQSKTLKQTLTVKK